MTIEETWLDIDEPSTALTVAEPQELEVLNVLTAEQRTFVELLTYCRYNTVEARQLYRDKTNNVLTMPALARWLVNPDFVAACAKMESLSAQLHGISKAQVIADLAEIKTRNQGRGEKGDRLALTALEQISKCLGQYQNDEDKNDIRVGPALVIQLTNRVGGEILSEVKVGIVPNLPGPERLVNP